MHKHSATQLQFEKTATTLCSTASLVWLITILHVKCIDITTDEKIDQILNFANKLHFTVQNKLHKVNQMLTVEEVLKCIPVPEEIETMFDLYYGHNLTKDKIDCVPNIPNTVHLNKISNILKANTGAVFTCNMHNVAIYAYDNQAQEKKFLIFDSLPACTYEVYETDLQNCILSIFKNIAEFNLCHLHLV